MGRISGISLERLSQAYSIAFHLLSMVEQNAAVQWQLLTEAEHGLVAMQAVWGLPHRGLADETSWRPADDVSRHAEHLQPAGNPAANLKARSRNTHETCMRRKRSDCLGRAPVSTLGFMAYFPLRPGCRVLRAGSDITSMLSNSTDITFMYEPGDRHHPAEMTPTR
jgi:hypothetical protein